MRSLLALLLLVPKIGASDATLGLLFRLNSSGVPLSIYWTGVGCAGLLAVQHFNARDARVVPQLANLTSAMQLQSIVLDTDSVEVGGIRAYRSALAAGVHGLVGPSRSAVCQPTAQLGALDSLPQLSQWASSPSLSEKSIYSHFGRTYPSDALSGTLLMRTMTSFGWRKAGVIYINDLYAQGLVDVMHSWSFANPDGVRIALAKSFAYGDGEGAVEAVAELAASGLNIIVFIVFDEDLDAVLTAADAAGLLGDHYVWICADTTTADSPQNTPDPALTAQRLAGSLAMSVAPSLTDGYGHLSSIWSGLEPADCANELFTATPDVFQSQAPPDVGAFAYDAVIALGLALAEADAEGESLDDGDAVRSRTWAQTFNGATGEVKFSSETGDRLFDGLKYALFNFRVDADGASEMPIVGSAGADGLELSSPIIWRDGGSVAPFDVSTQPTNCEPGHVQFISSSGTAICSQCEAGKYELSRRLCMEATSSSYVPRPASDETGVIDCPTVNGLQTRVLELLAELNGQLGVRVQTRQGARAQSECQCDEGSYDLRILGHSASNALPLCTACPAGAMCAGGELSPVALPGYAQLAHSDPTEPPHFFRCKVADGCPGGTIEAVTPTSDTQGGAQGGVAVVTTPYRCADGYLNGSSLCYRCEDGFGMRAGGCVKCGAPGPVYFSASLVFVLVWFPVLRAILTQYVKSFYTSIAFVQFMGVYASFAIPWGSSLKSLFESLGSFNLNLDAVYISCSTDGGGMTFSQVWLVQMLLPLLYPVAVVLDLLIGITLSKLAAKGAHPLRKLILLGWRPRRDFGWDQLVARYLPPGLFFLNMYLMMGVGNSLRMLACVDDNNGSQYLRADPQMQCWTGSHIWQAVVAVIGCCVYMGAVPAVYCWLLFHVIPTRGRENRLARAFSFIYGRFEQTWHWWELIESGRKVEA